MRRIVSKQCREEMRPDETRPGKEIITQDEKRNIKMDQRKIDLK